MANKFGVAGSESKYKEPEAEPAGFWAGVWHGMSMPITFIVSLLKPGVSIYETNNNGKGYNFGFVIGASMAFGGGKKGVKIDIDSSEAEDDTDIDE